VHGRPPPRDDALVDAHQLLELDLPVKRLLAVALLAACATGQQQRYVMAEDSGSRHHFKYVFDTQSKRWAHRECELRVDPARRLSGDVSMQLFRSISVSSAYATPEGDRFWRIRHVMDRDDLRGRVAYGVQIAWPRRGEETRHEPLELFRLPPITAQEPYAWSDWTVASDFRAGAFGWWEEAHGVTSSPPASPAHPFSIRCRIVLADVPGRMP
jgi:hypothetical protein